MPAAAAMMATATGGVKFRLRVLQEVRRQASRGGFVVGTSLSLGFFVAYWALLIAGEELADRGLLSPLLGMWSPNVLLACLGILLMWQIQSENRVWRLDILDFFRKKTPG